MGLPNAALVHEERGALLIV